MKSSAEWEWAEILKETGSKQLKIVIAMKDNAAQQQAYFSLNIYSVCQQNKILSLVNFREKKSSI